MENRIVLVMSIVNNGFSDKVMDIARKLGARGGTILNASGSASVDAEKLYGITINPEKEVVMILVSNDIVKDLLNLLYQEVGSDTEAQGIAFTLPVDEATSNLTKQIKKEKK
ncbi:MAG: hypothetical protein MRZ09_02860 [Coprobacillus sp.]|nr:hypothetical protein [Coprobacillus sp.]MDY4144835.1 P-II family nitrogen regulator [Bacilli bacterium]CCY07717.1 putative nitrogen regulatory protein P-II [Coprobacillus sp. CAG:698]